MAKLADLRRRKALSMRELGERAGLTLNTVWRLENDRSGAHPKSIRKLAAALGVEPEELIAAGDAHE